MTNYAIGIKDILEAASVGVGGTDIFIGQLPEEDIITIAIMNTGGKTPNPKWLLDEPSMQVMVRGTPKDYISAYDKALEVKDALLGLPSQDINGDRWVQVNMIGDIVNLGYDENVRVLFSLNFALIIEPAASGTTNRTALS